jgi:histidine kinase/DNA gyrase B/HSP90-like ATPase
VGSVRLRPADAFDLIRWLAQTQSDPRKAVAELVQNSLDAGARHIRVDRRRLRGEPALVVHDDGEGVLPELPREEALRWIATHVGHSRKLGLSPAERRERVVAGKYGVGLLGFWAMGRRFEMRSRVGGSELLALRLAENEPQADIARLPGRIDAPPTFTEVVVYELHEAALRPLSGRRLADYLAAELRGQLLGKDVELSVHDGIARGNAQKSFTVVPRRFVGERLALPAEVDADGHPPLRVEIYLGRGLERPAIQVACAGTLVADDIGELQALGLAEAPWVGRELTGLVDFPAFSIPPGTRRGVLPDKAAVAFVGAMEKLRPLVEAELFRLQRERQAAADREVVSQLRRALRGFRRRLPNYDLPSVATGGEAGPKEAASGEALGENGASEETTASELFPPGPLVSLRIVPPEVKVAPGDQRRVRAVPADAEGRRLHDGVALAWTIEGAGLALLGEGPRPAVLAEAGVPLGATGRLRVEAAQGEAGASAEADVIIAERDEPEGGLGIPEPDLVDEPGESWRSRYHGTRWEVNQQHEDYLALRGEPRARLRYLLALLAKEIVQRSYGQPGTSELLERVVEVLAHAERNLRGT